MCVLFCFVNCNEMFVCYIVLWTALKCECIVVNYADALMCYGSVLFTCSSVRKLAYFHWVACVCVYVTLAMCSQTCKVMHHVLLLMQGRCCSFTNPVSSCLRTFQQVALDFCFVLTAMAQSSASCTSLVDFSNVWSPPALSSSFSATGNPSSCRLLSLQVSSWPLGKFWWLCLVWLWSSDGCVWCGCGVLMVAFVIAGLKEWSFLAWRRTTTRDCATTGPGAPGTPFRSFAGDVLPQ